MAIHGAGHAGPFFCGYHEHMNPAACYHAMRLALALAAALVTATALAQPGARGAAEPPGVVAVRAEVKPFPLSAEALGNARANEAVDIQPQITAAVTAIRFAEGQQVQQGEVLVELENSEPLAELAAARARLVDSESQYRRSRELFRTQVVSESQLEQLEAQRDADEAAVNAASARLEHSTIRAPFSGQIGLRRISVGSVVTPSSVITTLDDTSRIKLDFDVPEVFLSRLQPGLHVTARSAAWPGLLFDGEVSSIDTRVDPVSRTVTVRAVMPNDHGKLRPGMFLTVTLLKDDVVALMVPEEAIVPERSQQFVFVVGDDNRVTRQEVRTGRRRPGEVEVLDGLEAGSLVITEGTVKVRPGQEVRLIEPAVAPAT